MEKTKQQMAWNARIVQMAVGILKRKNLIGGNGKVKVGDLIIKAESKESEEDDCMFRIVEITIEIFWKQKRVFAIDFEYDKSDDQFKDGIKAYIPGKWESHLKSAHQQCIT